jgi:DNA-binding response OmpR family regulator
MDYRLYIWPHYVLEWLGGRIPLSPMEGIILSRLVKGQAVSYDELTESIWGHDEDGGPIDPDNNLGVVIHRIRRKFRDTPFSVPRASDRHVRLMMKTGFGKVAKALDDIADNVLDP